MPASPPARRGKKFEIGTIAHLGRSLARGRQADRCAVAQRPDLEAGPALPRRLASCRRIQAAMRPGTVSARRTQDCDAPQVWRHAGAALPARAGRYTAKANRFREL